MPKVPILGVLFDLDGTVADTMGIHEDIESCFLRELGVSISGEELTMRFGGVSLQDTFRAVIAEAYKGREHEQPSPDLDALSSRKKELLHARWKEYRLMPGIIELTSMLRRRGIALAIASSSRLETIELMLNTLDIRNRFKVIASTKECGQDRGKPNPDVFLLAAKRLGLAPENCLVIGDAPSDVAGARAAGMRCIALWKHRQPLDPRLAEMIVTDLRQIPESFF